MMGWMSSYGVFSPCTPPHRTLAEVVANADAQNERAKEPRDNRLTRSSSTGTITRHSRTSRGFSAWRRGTSELTQAGTPGHSREMEEVSPEVRTSSVTRGEPTTPPVQLGRARPYVTRVVKKPKFDEDS
ncbi:hypothetical protein PRIPAC_90097 [Pristionchus pacificus]|uniref:Uncharacterized protein n=1 Tax=Pristionchus pacificus TaxID=54126 RepID=A0A454XTS0_PRIPA|nr:hypothetical protein PRIPAC_90097 [Pristionchus pacificus]|eukprot:PDM61785.1 hypothetical protein PRIPAC_51227 [Pristionchus pacificus]